MVSKKISIAVTTAVAALLVAIASPATAATPTLSEERPATTLTDVTLDALTQGVSGAAGSVTFDSAPALAAGADVDAVSQFAAGISAGGGEVLGVAVDQDLVRNVQTAQAQVAAGCVGETNVTTQWYGWQTKINSCQAATLVASVAAGASTATVAGLVTSWTGFGGISAGAIASILAAGAGFMAVCSASGQGMILNLAWTGIPWCASQ